MTQQPAISVITIVRNGERYLAQALQSILDQSYPVHELIVVVGQSHDRTAAVVRSFPSVCVIKQQNHGLANARNLGLQAAKGKFIAFLDHDDLWTPDKLRKQVYELLAHPELMYVCGLVQRFVDPDSLPAADNQIAGMGLPVSGRTPGALLARRNTFECVGDFDPAYRIACDSDWFVRADDCNLSWKMLSHVVLHKRIHGGNISNSRKTYRQEWLHVLRRSVNRKRQGKC